MPLSDYEKLSKLGSGGFADAVIVRLKSDASQKFVLKEMTYSTGEERQDCLTEVDLLKQLTHRHIVQFRETFAGPGIVYLVMEYCAGGDMAKLITLQSKKCYFLEVRIIYWTLQILEALQYLHGRRPKPILHRDMKPANIFLTENLEIKIGDFGVSRELVHFKDLATTVCGTPLYLSPEVFRQQPYDHKCDIWSLGCCVYEMMLFKSAINPLLLAVLNIPSVNPMPDNYSAALIDIVRRMLLVDPNARPSADEVMSTLQALPEWNPNDKRLTSFTELASKPTASSATASAQSASDNSDDDPTLKDFEVIDSMDIHKNRLAQGPFNSSVDPDETLKPKVHAKHAAAARVWSPEKVFEYHGYRFNDAGCLVDIKTEERFKYEVNPDKKYNEDRYQVIAQAVTQHIHNLLEKTLNMQRIYVPLDCEFGEPWSFIYTTTDIFTNPRILILIGGWDPIRAGLWSRKAIINDSIDAGSQIPCIKQAIREGYAVLLLNQNQTYLEVDGVRCEVRKNESPLRHILYVWDKIILDNTQAKNVAFFTHTAGGELLAELAIEREDSFKKLVFGMALCQSRHDVVLKRASKPISDLFAEASMHWIASDRPLNESSKKGIGLPFGKDKSRRMSAGDARPDWVVYSCKDSAFTFLRELYKKRQKNS